MAWKKGQSGNPKGRPRKDKAEPKTDNLVNLITGLGVVGKDKRLSTTHETRPVSWEEAEDKWRGNDLAARIIETIPNEMMRQGFEFHDESDKDLEEFVCDRWDELGIYEALWDALAYQRAYGGGAILLGANDGATDLKEPLDLSRVRSFDWVTTLEPRELTPVYWYNNPRAAKFGKPAIYQLNPISPGQGQLLESNSYVQGSTQIHESRLIVFPGIKVSRRMFGDLAGWGDSILTRVEPVLRDFGLSWGAAGTLIADFAQAVFKIEGLANIVANDQQEAFKARLQALDLSRSTLRAIVIDSKEDFERKTTPITGLPDLLDRFATRLAAAADMPLTLLMGQSPAGLNATGESDIRFFYDRVKAMQQRLLKPALERITSLILANKGLKGKNSSPYGTQNKVWSIEFCPLWQPTEKEKAEVRLLVAQADQIYLDRSVISAAEVAVSRFGGDGYSMETTVDFEARESLEPAAPDPVPSENQPENPDPNSPDQDNPAREENPEEAPNNTERESESEEI